GKEVEKKPLSAREALLKASETVKNTEKEPDSAKDKDGKAKATAEADAKALADKKAADAVAKAKTPQVDQTQSKPVDTQQKPT
ncbi:hypothetical protein, partial [Aeromonas veronii]|uniref:hypothetical protein n=1 Tax=Aeromonas veronii TaxID=654 RepID=UPI00406C9363